MIPILIDWGYWELRSKVTFDGVARLITVNPGVTSLDIRADIYSAWAKWVLLADNVKFLPAIRYVGGDAVSSTKDLGITFFLINNWRIRPAEESHRIGFVGNLYTDPAGDSPVLQTLGSYSVVVEMEVSTLVESTLAQQPEIERSAFSNYVCVDSTSALVGTAYPRGTRQSPVNNLADALLIASTRGIGEIKALSALTIGGGHVLDGLTVSSDNWIGVTVEPGASVHNTVFEKVTLYGRMGGLWNVLIDCWIYSVTNLTGWVRGGSIIDLALAPYTVENTGQTYIDDLVPFYPGVTSNITTSTDTKLAMTGCREIVTIHGLTAGSSVTCGLLGGVFNTAATCVGGSIALSGVGEIESNLGTAPIDSSGLVNAEIVVTKAEASAILAKEASVKLAIALSA